ncbi:uncharacterized protein LOC132745095 isoform X2 [Ruditapes philippinarum]|uniref:uncharacterized protein LOC132745095 isoform X2 n=1 Tax=Ruditapes philippinarum TaxID=129788 RepID=UPI00295B75E9|nr:uncharacterized protein LOC132745095 isoform X2 [Ruditapes philippinarum]
MSGLSYHLKCPWSPKRILIGVLILGICLLLIKTFWSGKSEDKTAHLSSHLPTIVEIEKIPQAGTYISTQTIALAKLIRSAKKHARGSKTLDYLMQASDTMDALLTHMDINPESVYQRSLKTPTSVCPEQFKDGHAGWPLYHTGFDKVDCNYGQPLSSLITIIKSIRSDNRKLSENFEEAKTFISSVSKTFENVNVMIAVSSTVLSNQIKQLFPKLKVISYEGESEGIGLNKIISSVNTPYLLIARNVEFMTNDSRLERLISVKESLDVAYVGASFRYRNGHWRKGCYQSVYRNFTLKYKEGYDESFQGCMYCDYSKGPFLTSTKYIKRNSFQDLNEDRGLYEDWFLRVYQKGEEGIVCPDSMFDTNPRPVSSVSWNSFFDIWNLFQIRIPGGITISKKCGKKESSSSPSKAMSLCKYLDTTEAVKVVMRSCAEVGMICELQEGTTLGAVKMEKTIPWDIDYDLRFITNNCSLCKKLADKFKNNGMSYGDFVTPCCTKVLKLGEINYVGVGYKRAGGDISGHPTLDTEIYSKMGFKPTKVFFDGEWLNVPRNPGFILRNRYGLELFQHAEHWRFTDGNEADPRLTYKAFSFSPCSTPGRHECLDRYNPDGNIQFKGLLP